MKTYKLGELITQRREKNNETGLPIRGVSREGLIPPKQMDADTSIYNVFYLRDFIFNPARMELNSIAFNDKYEKAICSSLYEVFYVHREDIVLPEYLKLIVKQDWFTRYCEFLGQGSAREYCRFANISEINIELPDIETQKKAVYCDKVINERIALKRRINDNLDETMLAIYRKYFVQEIDETNLPIGWSVGTLKDIYQFQYGKGNNNPDNGGQYPIYGSNGVIGGYHEYNNENEPVIGHIGAAGSLNYAFGKHYVTYNGIMCNIINPRDNYFGYLTLYAQNLAAQVRGSTQPFISYDMLYEIKTVLPPNEVLQAFADRIAPFMSIKRCCLQEIAALHQVELIMQERMSSI